MNSIDQEILSTFAYFMRSLSQPLTPMMDKKIDALDYADVIVSGINESIYNNVLIKQPVEPDALINSLRDLRQALDLPLTAWVTVETENAQETGETLAKHFTSPGAFYGMSLDLSHVKLPKENRFTGHVEQVTNNKQAELFARVHCDTFGFKHLLERKIQWAKQQLLDESPKAINFIAKLDDEVAGVSSLILNQDFTSYPTGGFYNACTIDKYRNQGVAMAMASHRIALAKCLGLKTLSIVLMSDAMARGYCEYLGFSNQAVLVPYYIV